MIETPDPRSSAQIRGKVFQTRKAAPKGGSCHRLSLVYLKNASAWAKRLLISSQFTTFHQAFR
jgi:hypothetical protein